MRRIVPGKSLEGQVVTPAEAWYHGVFDGCPCNGSGYPGQRVDTCLKRQEVKAAHECFNDRCDVGLKVKEGMGNLSVFEIRKKVGDV